MTVATEILPLTDTVAPADQAALAAVVRDAYAAHTAIYPLGGATALGYGVPARRAGLGLSLAALDGEVDYPARDMTITVEAGITMSALGERLAGERQRLPVDVPQASRATLGGVIATDTSGPRRYGYGSIRDYVIGISAVDGRGEPFRGGGRVVKNVAGYDFCKLLTGSFGTLGVITQVTLKVRPAAEASALVQTDVLGFDQAESLLAGLVASATTPSAIELLAGPAWRDDPALGDQRGESVARLLVALEGTADEVAWMVKQLLAEWREAGAFSPRAVDHEAARDVWPRLIEFPAPDADALVLRINVLPSAVAHFVARLTSLAPHCSLQAHAGSGIIIARFREDAERILSRHLIGELQPAASVGGGSVVVLAPGGASDLTRQIVWGPATADVPLMAAVKRQFDPRGLLNPGRFVYPEM